MSGLVQSILALDAMVRDETVLRTLRPRERQICRQLQQSLHIFTSKVRAYQQIRHGPRAPAPTPTVTRATRVNLLDIGTVIDTMVNHVMGFMGHIVHEPIPQPLPDPVPDQKVSILEYVVFQENQTQGNDDAKQCNICREDFAENEHITKTSCCRTKFMHINCAIQCLRRSDRCPFCQASHIAFR